MKLQMSLEILISLALAMLIASYALFSTHSLLQEYYKGDAAVANVACLAINESMNAAGSCQYCVYETKAWC